MNIDVIKANYHDQRQAQDIVDLLDSYARDPMGGGEPLSGKVKANLVSQLAARPFAFSCIAYADGAAVGLVNCFESFSTFLGKPIINIHDIVVIDSHRGKGISHRLLNKVEEIALDMGCCKLTLEVLSGNEVAKSAYRKFGFSGYELDSGFGNAQFWQKKLTD